MLSSEIYLLCSVVVCSTDLSIYVCVLFVIYVSISLCGASLYLSVIGCLTGLLTRAVLGRTKVEDYSEGENEMNFDVSKQAHILRTCVMSALCVCVCVVHVCVSYVFNTHLVVYHSQCCLLTSCHVYCYTHPPTHQTETVDISGISPSTLTNSGLLMACLMVHGEEVAAVNMVVNVTSNGGDIRREVLSPLE